MSRVSEVSTREPDICVVAQQLGHRESAQPGRSSSLQLLTPYGVTANRTLFRERGRFSVLRALRGVSPRCVERPAASGIARYRALLRCLQGSER